MPPGARKLLALALAVLALTVGCSSGDDDDDDRRGDDAETSSNEVVRASVELDVNSAELVSPHQAIGPLDAATAEKVAAVVERLLLVTSAAPLTEGRAGGAFPELFTASAGSRAANEDREVFFDEGLPRFGELLTKQATVGLTALAGSTDPAPALVVAKYAWEVSATANQGHRIARSGELSLIPVDGTWRIGAYTVVVTRTIANATTTTTASFEEDES